MQQQYNIDISDSVPTQVVLLVSVLRREIKKIETIREVADLVKFVKFVDLSASFWEVCSVLILLLTIRAVPDHEFTRFPDINRIVKSRSGQIRIPDIGFRYLNLNV